MASQQPGVWGIDLGQCALKAIRLEQKDGQVTATAFEYIEHPKILSQPDADPDQLTREALEQFLSRNSIRGDMVVISVPGQSGLARFVKLPPVEEKKIADIVRFEAKQQIPFPLEEVVWDYQKLSTGGLGGGAYVETEIGLFAMKRDMVNRALAQFKEVKVEVHVIQMAPLALCNFVAYDLLGRGVDGAKIGGEEGAEEEEGGSQKKCIVALDVGTDNSNLVITDGDKIIWQRPIPLGGNHFTRALTKDLKLTFAKAEHLKRNAAKSPDLKKILASLKSVLNDFVGEVQRSLGYFTNTHRDAQIQYMIGLGNACRLPGLQKFLQEKLQLEVRKMQKLERAAGEGVATAPTFHENILSFAVAYGLALQGLKRTRLQTNLLPTEVRLERIIRGKKPWAVTAAACLLLAVAGVSFSKSIEKAAVFDPKIDKRIADSEREQKSVKDDKAAYDSELQKITENIGSLKQLSSGVEDRTTWQLLHQYINRALPQPNGERLVEVSARNERVREKYLTKDAMKAYQWFEANRFRTGTELPPAQKREQDEFIKQNLIQLNLEAVTMMYSDDLKPYFENVHKWGNLLVGMFEGEKKKIVAFVKDGDAAGLPTSGWVVEIRGYTYHKDADRFVENTIIENLQFPENLKNLEGKDIEMPADMKKTIRDNVSFLLLLKNETVPNPQPGQFAFIGGTFLPGLLAGGNRAAAAVPAPPPMAAPAGNAPAAANAAPAAPKINPSWAPIGRGGAIAPAAVNAQVAPAGRAPAGGVAARTEFVVLFVWKDTGPAPEAAAAGN